MKRYILPLSALFLAGLAGCDPKEFVVWSPDTGQAVVFDDTKVFLTNAAGKTSPPLPLENSVGAAWLPDSQQVLIPHQRKAKTWDELSALLPASQRQAIIEQAEKLRLEILSPPEWDEKQSPVLQSLSDTEKVMVVIYLRDKHSQGLPEKLGKKWDLVKEAAFGYTVFQLFSAGDLSLKPGETILIWLSPVMQVRLSPDGKKVAFVAGKQVDGQPTSASLYVAPLQPGASAVELAQWVALYPDWSADGQYLVYGRAFNPPMAGNQPLRLGSLTRLQVCDKDGTFLPTLPGDQEDLASVLFLDSIRVRCLRDGRILFAAANLQLPVTKKDLPGKLTLYTLDPREGPTITPAVPPSAMDRLGSRADLFELSPGQQKISVPGAEGQITILDLADESLTQMDIGRWPEGQGKLLMIPTWRSADDLCFAAPQESSRQAKLVLRSPRETTTLSQDWSKELMPSWLTIPVTSQPSSAPQ